MSTPVLTGERARELIAAATEEIRSERLAPDPVVSVRLITYNQARFIRQAIDSVLSQRTRFPFELVIADDGSKDGTTEIALDYQRRFPERIRVLLARENLGRHTGNGRLNFVRGLWTEGGRYVALLEGDDYWACRDKLERQVQRLDREPEVAFCCHAVTIVFEDGHRPPHKSPRSAKALATIDDLLAADNFVRTCSVMFRREALPELPDWYFSIPIGDWALWCLLALSGKIGFSSRAMSVYRIHDGGLWSSKSEEHRWSVVVQIYQRLASTLGDEYRDRTTAGLAAVHARLAEARRAAGDVAGSVAALSTALELLLRVDSPPPAATSRVLSAIADACGVAIQLDPGSAGAERHAWWRLLKGSLFPRRGRGRRRVTSSAGVGE